MLRLLVIIHSLAAFASLANALPWIYKPIPLIAVGCSLFLYLRRYHLQFEPYHIKRNEDSVWYVDYKSGDFQVMQILPSSVITSWLIVLHFRLEHHGKRHSLVILNDALNDKDYRTLAVILKIAEL